MNLYKLRNKETGLFSTGGLSPIFNKKGKVWKQLNHIKSHLTQFRPTKYSYGVNRAFNENYLNSVEIVEYVLSEEIQNVKVIEVEKY